MWVTSWARAAAARISRFFPAQDVKLPTRADGKHRKRGGLRLSVTTGTINHAAMLARLLTLDLDAVTSDSPHELRQAISAAPPRSG
jgi:hypothetical protein